MKFLSFLLAISTVCLSLAGHAASVEQIRSWPAPEKMRVVFDLSAATEYSVFAMENPDRLVVDFKDSRAGKSLNQSIAKNKLIKSVRSATQQNKQFRVVLDLRHQVPFRAFTLAPNARHGHRLVLDLGQSITQLARKSNKANSKTLITKQPERKTTTVPVRDLVIAVDAGHGGKDPGAIGSQGTHEKDIALILAKKLARKINKEQGMRAVLTRKGDYYLDLRERMEIARENNADLFISLHADAFRDKSVRGSSVFVLSEKGESSEAAKWLADKENAADMRLGGVALKGKDSSLTSVLIDLQQNATKSSSLNVANKVLAKMKKVGQTHKPSVQKAGFMVLKSPDIPSILIEMAFISNPKEEKKLRDKRQQNLLADAILKGVKNYYSEYAPAGTRLASR